MRSRVLVVIPAMAALVTGCATKADVQVVADRVTVLETAHNATRAKLDSLAFWAGGAKVTGGTQHGGVQGWIEETHDKVWATEDPGDPVKPPPPPPPF